MVKRGSDLIKWLKEIIRYWVPRRKTEKQVIKIIDGILIGLDEAIPDLNRYLPVKGVLHELVIASL